MWQITGKQQILRFELQKNCIQLKVKEIFQRNTGDVINRTIFGFSRATAVNMRKSCSDPLRHLKLSAHRDKKIEEEVVVVFK